MLETDHAPHTLAEKRAPFATAPAGVPGVETAYPVLLRFFDARGLSPEPLIRAFSENPAARMNLRKGRIERGFDADFFAYDPRKIMRINGPDLQSKCGWTPFQGWEAFRIDTHLLHGMDVVEDGQFVGRQGQGRPVNPATPAPWIAPAPP
jgi:dihydroorotase